MTKKKIGPSLSTRILHYISYTNEYEKNLHLEDTISILNKLPDNLHEELK